MIEGLLSDNNVDISFWSFDVSTLSGYVQISDEVRVRLFVCWSLMSTRLGVEISA